MGKNKGFFGALFVFFLAVFSIAFTNYHQYTLLTGWDNLHSEFNFAEHFNRAISAVWQEHQGIGTVMAATYALDLPRFFYLWILSWVFPTEMLRYVFHFSMLFIGTLGTYFAIKTFFINEGKKIRNIASIFGALFYLFNLATVQYFATPFEPFSVFWAVFPWLMYGNLRYLQSPTSKNLIIFAALHIIATPMAYVPTVFYVYLLVLLVLFATYLPIYKNKQIIRTITKALLVFFLVNAFWLLPHAYWFATNRSIQQTATMNVLSTDETYQLAQQFGDFSDFVLLRNKPWEYHDLINSQQQFLLQAWHTHFSNPVVVSIGYLLFTFVVIGIFTTKSNRWFLIGVFFLSFLVLANQAPISREFNILLRQIEIVNQVFRDPFTKFIVPTLFIFAVGFSGGIVFLHKLFPSRVVTPLSLAGGIGLGVLLIIYMLPVFSGHFFANRMKVETPHYYFDFFNYMQQQDQTKRIANLPQGPIWGWTSYGWGYTGSGFLWHGFGQSITDRTFDVWNDKNEEYYWELIYALNKRNYDLFHSILKKYDISYVMFDSAIYFPDNPNSIFTIIRQKEFINNDKELRKVKSFGTIDLYEFEKSSNNYIAVIDQPISVGTQTNWLGEDKAYRDYGNYIVQNVGEQVYYPFRSLFSARGTRDVSYQVSATPNAFIFQQQIPSGTLIFPEINEEEFTRLDPIGLSQTKLIPQVITNGMPIVFDAAVNEGELEIIVERDNRYGSYDSNLHLDAPLGIEALCDVEKQEKEKKWIQVMENNDSRQFVRFSSLNARTCRAIPLPELSHRIGYIVGIESRNREGNTLRFWIENITEKRSDQQMFLKKQVSFGWEYFVIPPMAEDGVGYVLHFDNVSIGKQQSTNDLSQVVIYPIPYSFLTGLKIVNQAAQASSVRNDVIVSVAHPFSYRYNVSLQRDKLSSSSVVALYQTYNHSWNAYVVDGWLSRTFPMIFGRELKEHVLVNNWANGWMIDPQLLAQDGAQVTIAIVFWPQLLQYLGFALLPLPFVYALWPRKKNKN